MIDRAPGLLNFRFTPELRHLHLAIYENIS